MTSRDFELVAQVIRESRDQVDGVMKRPPLVYVDLLAVHFAEALAKHNPRFDRERFLKACAE